MHAPLSALNSKRPPLINNKWDMDNYIQVASIMSVHGVKGLVRVKSFTSPEDNLFSYKPLCDQYGIEHQLGFKNIAKDSYICQLDNIHDRDMAENFKGLRLYLHRDHLPDISAEDEFYYCDLIGLSVFGQSDQKIGHVHAVQNFGAGDLLEIKPLLVQSNLFGNSSVNEACSTNKLTGINDTVCIPFNLEWVPYVSIAEKKVIINDDLFFAMRDLSLKKLDPTKDAVDNANAGVESA